MEILIIGIIFLIIVMRTIKNKNKNKNKINIEQIISNGTLLRSDKFKGEVFYKSSTIDGEDNLCFYSYIRLNNGTDIAINNEDIYRNFYIGTNINIIEKIYKYKAHELTFYLIKLNNEKELTICEQLT